MTDGLGLKDAYGATLDRIKALGDQKSRLGMTVLMWICHLERPLGVEELRQALAVEIGSADHNANNAPSITTILSCCQGLVMVDKEGLTIRLIHYTLHEYLTCQSDLFRNPHAKIAETCLTYLNSQQVMALSGSYVHQIKRPPFLEYSSLYWGAHMKKEPSDGGKTLALKLLSRYECHISIRLLLEHTIGSYHFDSIVNIYKFTGLHFASIFGLAEIAEDLTKMDGIDVNGIDEAGARPLEWAAKNGHEAVVKLLLERKDVNPDRPDKWDQTPITRAAGNGHEAVVKLLLERKDVNPDRPDNNGQTPISWAAKNGHEAVVKLLLGRKDVNPDRLDKWDHTPIALAAGNGHEAVVKLLLERKDVNPDRPDNNGQTPITWAARYGHEAVVKLLQGEKDTSTAVFDI